MTGAYNSRYRFSVRKAARRLALLIFIILILLNVNSIARVFYPFPYREMIINSSYAVSG